jgi:phage terminase large subunit
MKSLNDYEKQGLLEQFLELTASEFDEGVSAQCKFTPRDYQKPVLEALEGGIRRACLVWHRRSGKDLTMIHWITRCIEKRPGVYYHLLPTFTQAKRIIWDGRDLNGRPFLNYFPRDLIARKNETELKVHFRNGSIYQLIGTDHFDSIVGPNPVGCVFSEYALQNPQAWELITPILLENQGWAVFCFTPRGKNHAWKLFQSAKNDPEWFTERLTVDQTRREDGSPVIRWEEVQKEIDAGRLDPDLAEQEFRCSWNAPQVGSYYGKLLEQAEKEGRIGKVPWEPKLPVDTFWDLGVGDSTAIWFTQAYNKEIRVIDYLESSGEGLPYYKKELDKKPYAYGQHWAPHDIEVRELGSGKSRRDIARSLGIRFNTVPNIPIDDGIQAVRAIIPRCWFDRDKCSKGLDALMAYHKEWDDKNQCFKDHPAHDWSSHSADSFRYFAVGFRERRPSSGPSFYQTEFDPFARNYGVRPELIREGWDPMAGEKTMESWDPFQDS